MSRYIVLIFVFFLGCKAKEPAKPIGTIKLRTIKFRAKPVLILDAGHGAIDPGAINDSLNLYEKNVTRKIVDAVLAIIDTNKISVVQTRPADSNIHRHDRINLANTYHPDLLLTVHINYDKDTSYNGFEMAISDSLVTKMDEKDTISILNPNKVKAEKIATTFSNKVAGLFPKMRQRKMKIRDDRIWMICAGNYPSVLLEFGFISNKNDLEYITDKKSIKKLAAGIVESIYKELLPITKTKHKTKSNGKVKIKKKILSEA
jgi:N-acetylmuramoyl-L-alanine amidase